MKLKSKRTKSKKNASQRGHPERMKANAFPVMSIILFQGYWMKLSSEMWQQMTLEKEASLELYNGRVPMRS